MKYFLLMLSTVALLPAQFASAHTAEFVVVQRAAMELERLNIGSCEQLSLTNTSSPVDVASPDFEATELLVRIWPDWLVSETSPLMADDRVLIQQRLDRFSSAVWSGSTPSEQFSSSFQKLKVAIEKLLAGGNHRAWTGNVIWPGFRQPEEAADFILVIENATSEVLFIIHKTCN